MIPVFLDDDTRFLLIITSRGFTPGLGCDLGNSVIGSLINDSMVPARFFFLGVVIIAKASISCRRNVR